MAKGVVVLRRHLVVGGIVAALVIGGLTAAGIASATVTTNTYSACLSSIGGVPYNVTVNGTPRCLGRDQVISWNQTGPAGTNGTNGVATSITEDGTPNTTTVAADGGEATATAPCPDGDVLLSGGYSLVNTGSTPFTTVFDAPDGASGAGGTWAATIENDTASTSGSVTLTAYAVCT